MKDTIKVHAVSFTQTFIATFLATIGTIIIAIPAEKLSDPHTWTTSAIAGVLIAAVRVAIKAAWTKLFPTA